MAMVALLAALAMASAVEPSGAPMATTSNCAATASGAFAPLVPDKRTAKAIFVAIERAKSPMPKLIGHGELRVIDNGDNWTVYRYHAPEFEKGRINVDYYAFEVKIDKCDGRTRAGLMK